MRIEVAELPEVRCNSASLTSMIRDNTGQLYMYKYR